MNFLFNVYVIKGKRCAIPDGFDYCAWETINANRIRLFSKTQGELIYQGCDKCKHYHPLTEFYSEHGFCRKCHTLKVKNWQKRNPEKVKASKAKTRAKKCNSPTSTTQNPSTNNATEAESSTTQPGNMTPNQP